MCAIALLGRCDLAWFSSGTGEVAASAHMMLPRIYQSFAHRSESVEAESGLDPQHGKFYNVITTATRGLPLEVPDQGNMTRQQSDAHSDDAFCFLTLIALQSSTFQVIATQHKDTKKHFLENLPAVQSFVYSSS